MTNPAPATTPQFTRYDAFSLWAAKRWLPVFLSILAVYNGLPFAAPVLMAIQFTAPARLIYFIYGFLCHQLPQRSFFLFGAQASYSLGEIQGFWKETIHPLVLRQFIGSAEIGWKVAWSDRMVAMFTSLLLAALLIGWLRGRVRRLPLLGLGLFLLPMLLDGSTHMLSDLAGIGQGFRDSNAWLAAITGPLFPSSFYAGDALGSFNSWMRLLSGLFFGLGMAWFAVPYLDEYFSEVAAYLEAKKAYARLMNFQSSSHRVTL